MSWQDRELARVRRAALIPNGFFRPDAPWTSAVIAALVLVGALALLDLVRLWIFGVDIGDAYFVERPSLYVVVAVFGLVQWWRQRSAYREYQSDKATYDAADAAVSRDQLLKR